MQCPKCGNENLEPASVCQVCAAPLAPTPDADTPSWAAPATDQPLTAQLYAAAIGPVHTDYYLAHFARFDHRGKAVLTWNWPAFVATLGWMAFRRLWTEALVYLGLAVLAAVLLLGGLPLWLGPSESVFGGAAAALALLLCMPPALLANGIYYRAINRHVTWALAESPDIATTQERLRHYASSRPRALIVASVVTFLWLATSGLAIWQWWPETASAAPSSASPAPAPHTSAPLRSAAFVPPSLAPASAAPTALTASAPVAAVSTPSPAVSAPIAATASSVAAPRASAPVSAPAPARASAPAPAPAPTASTRAAAQPAPAPRHWVAIGIFSQPENAQRLRQQVLDLGLPVRSDLVQSRRGELTRVRVGPFDKRTQAKAAQQQLEQADIKGVLLKP